MAAKSLFTEPELVMIRAFMERTNPFVLRNEKCTEAKIRQLDVWISSSLACMRSASRDSAIEEGLECYLNIQIRNLLAICIGKPQMPVPDDLAEIVSEVNKG
jgi:hypothetical protein